jgi:hypothetical protein
VVSDDSLTLITHPVELRDRRQNWMVDWEVLIEIWYETLVSDPSFNTVVRRFSEELLASMG